VRVVDSIAGRTFLIYLVSGNLRAMKNRAQNLLQVRYIRILNLCNHHRLDTDVLELRRPCARERCTENVGTCFWGLLSRTVGKDGSHRSVYLRNAFICNTLPQGSVSDERERQRTHVILLPPTCLATEFPAFTHNSLER
jgi:hypothetical protein